MIKVIVTYCYSIDFNAEIDIELLNCRIKTSVENPYENLLVENTNQFDDKKTFFKISIITVELENYESIIDTAPMVRPKLLTILGLLSFITNYPFLTFDSFGGSRVVCESLPLPTKEIFIFEEKDYLVEVIQLRNSIKNDNEQLLSSLLDRWRKAYYLEKDSESNFIMFDEALLSYFHILELLSNKYYESQRNDAKLKIKNFIDDFSENIYHSKDSSDRINKLINEVMLSHLPVKSKILYMLSTQGLLTERVEYYVTSLIKSRNNIAHGRQAYQDKIIFPVPAFFPIIKKDIDFGILRCFTARIIAGHFKSDLYKDEWESYSKELLPTEKEILDFLNSEAYKKLTNKDFINGNINNITPTILFQYAVNNEIKIRKSLKALEYFIFNVHSNDEIEEEAVLIATVIVDYTNTLKQRCEDIIIYANDNELVPFLGKFRDMIYFLESKNISCNKLKELMRSKQIR
jgi:hypothetical protein